MRATTHRVVKFASGYDLGAFDCGEPAYNDWLHKHASNSMRAGICVVYLLLEQSETRERVVGYYAINPTQVASETAPERLARGWPEAVPGWRLGKLAVHVDLRSDAKEQWGRHLLRDALETIVRAAEIGGGKVIVVNADNAGLIDFYFRNGFKSTGAEEDLSLYMKVSTARKALAG